MKQTRTLTGMAVAHAMMAPAQLEPTVMVDKLGPEMTRSTSALGTVTGRSTSGERQTHGLWVYRDPTAPEDFVLDPGKDVLDQISVKAIEVLRSGQALRIPSTVNTPARILVMVEGRVSELIPLRKSIG